MSMLSIFQVSSSAISAQSQRLNVVASNLATADTVAAVRKETAARTEPFKGDAELTPVASSPDDATVDELALALQMGMQSLDRDQALEPASAGQTAEIDRGHAAPGDA